MVRQISPPLVKTSVALSDRHTCLISTPVYDTHTCCLCVDIISMYNRHQVWDKHTLFIWPLITDSTSVGPAISFDANSSYVCIWAPAFRDHNIRGHIPILVPVWKKKRGQEPKPCSLTYTQCVILISPVYTCWSCHWQKCQIHHSANAHTHFIDVVTFCTGSDVELFILLCGDLDIADISHYLSPRWSTTAVGEHHVCKEGFFFKKVANDEAFFMHLRCKIHLWDWFPW